MATVQKEKDSLWKAPALDYFITKTVEFGAHQPDRNILQVKKTTSSMW